MKFVSRQVLESSTTLQRIPRKSFSQFCICIKVHLAIAFKPLILAKFASKMYFGLTCMHEKVVDINPYGLRVSLRTQSMCI